MLASSRLGLFRFSHLNVLLSPPTRKRPCAHFRQRVSHGLLSCKNLRWRNVTDDVDPFRLDGRLLGLEVEKCSFANVDGCEIQAPHRGQVQANPPSLKDHVMLQEYLNDCLTEP